MAHTERTAAILLRSVAYGDADRIVTLLTEAHGKVALMARGARKSAKRFAGALEPYALLDAEVALGRGEVGRLAQASVTRAFPGILGELGRMSVAAAGLELVRELLPEREPPDVRLIPTVLRFFELLEGSSSEEARLTFCLRVLALAGLAPNLERCGRCGRPAPPERAALFDPALGSVVCRGCGGAPLLLRAPLRAAWIRACGRRWDEVAAERWAEPSREQADRALGAFVDQQLGRRLAGRGLVSQVREVERAYRRERTRAGPTEDG